MYIEVTQSMFIDAFTHADRKENFSYEGLCALFDYFQEMEECTESKIELDVIAICGDYTEYGNIEEYNRDYADEAADYDDIRHQTAFIEIEGTDRFIIQNY